MQGLRDLNEYLQIDLCENAKKHILILQLKHHQE